MKRAVAIAQVNTWSSATDRPTWASFSTTSRRVRWLLLVTSRKGV
jgi:hypothetical protein